MKSPDDTAARFARLRHEIVQSFMEGDLETWGTATEEARCLLGPNVSRMSEKAKAQPRNGNRFAKKEAS